MTRTRLIKHNPRFLSDEELLSNFVVRFPELELLLGITKDNTGPVNQHVIIIGPRGMGKTMLVRRFALAVRKDPVLGSTWYPLSLPEDIYVISGEGELWLQTLKQIANQEKEAGGEFERWMNRYDALSTERDDQRLRAQCLSAISEFAFERKKRLLLCVENLQMLFEQTSSNTPWDLRKTLLGNPEIMLVATAITHFEEITNVNKANYELFREITLKPLSTDDCRILWESITKEELKDDRIRPMEILAGGSPRLLATLASFAAGKPLSQLMDDLVEYIDDNTTYFKANVEALPNLERRVFVTLAEIWEPVEARMVAKRSRLDVNTTSAFLKKLVSKGAVIEAGKVGRKNLYQVTERLYNIYHLMRLSGVESERVKNLIGFMIPLYGPAPLANRLASEACQLDGDYRHAFIEGYKDKDILSRSNDESTRNLILRETPASFFTLPEAKDLVKAHSAAWWNKFETFINGNDYMSALNLIDSELSAKINYSGDDSNIYSDISILLLNKASVFRNLDKHEEAISLYDEVLKRFGENDRPELQVIVAWVLLNKASVLRNLDKHEEAISLYDEVVKRFGESDKPELLEAVAGVLNNKAFTLRKLERYEEAMSLYDEVVKRFGESDRPELQEQEARALNNKAVELRKLEKHEEAMLLFDEVVKRFGESNRPEMLERVATALNNKASTLGKLEKYEEAMSFYDEVVKRFGENDRPELLEQVATALNNKAYALGKLERYEEAISLFDEIVKRFGESDRPELLEQVAMALNNKAVALHKLDNYEEAMSLYDEIIKRFGESDRPELQKRVAETLNSKAWTVYLKRDFSRVDEAIQVALKATALTPQNPIHHTLACLFGMASRWEEAFAQTGFFLNDEEMLKNFPEDIISFIVEAVADGQAEGALQAIEGTKAESVMEPLLVALKMLTNTPFRAPQEVIEVANDVVKRIEERAKELKKEGDKPKARP